ncbi:IS3 family transposase [Blautia obeum]|uniref:IS3 family transposase n=1 Tax=Blautia obeum TaxID=40520 RepID=UPI003F6693C5
MYRQWSNGRVLGNFHSREELVSAIVEYIDYYRNDRPQRGLGILTPMEYHDMLMAA